MSYISEPYMLVGTTSPPFLGLQPCPIFVVCEKKSEFLQNGRRAISSDIRAMA